MSRLIRINQANQSRLIVDISGYASPIILFMLFVIFKLINRRMWVRTSDDFAVLSQTLDRLKWYKTDELDQDQTQREEEMRVLSPPQVSRQDLGETVQT